MSVETVSLIIAAFVNGSLGIAALMRNFRSRLCTAFALLAATLFAHDAVGVLDTFEYSGTWASPRLHILLTLMTGPAALFFLRQVVPGYAGRVKRAIWGYTALCLTFIPLLSLPLYERVARLVFIAAHVGWFIPAFIWIATLVAGYRSTELTRERLRLRYAFWGGVVVIAFYVTDALQFAGFHVPPLGTLARVLYLMFLFQTFIQKELMKAEELVAKLALFSAVAVMLSLIYLLLVSWVGDKRGLFFFNTLIASFVSIVLFDPMRSLTSRFTRRLFLRRHLMLEDELAALSQELLGTVEPAGIARLTAAALRKCLGVEASAFYLLERDGLTYFRVDGDKGRFVPELPASNPLVEYMSLRRGRPFVLETIENDRESFHSVKPRRFCESCVEAMRKLGADFMIPFLHEGKLVGFCAVTTGERIALSNEQLRLFIPLSQQIALLLKNAETFSFLRDRDKLAAVGEMAAGLAHEIKNPLGAIKGAAQLLKGEIRGGEGADEFLQIIVDETDRLSGVLTDFLDYAKPRRNFPQSSCDPLRVIEHTAALILHDSKVSLEIISEQEGIKIDADPEALKQVLLNLFLNAVQAMEGHAEKPTLRVKVSEIRPRRLFAFAEGLPLYKMLEGWEKAANPSALHPFIEIEVCDNGLGIAPEDLPRIFVPFYTTKPKGTGLGLAICQRLIEGMGGTIHVKPNRPSGSIFTIHLPVRRDEAHEPRESSRAKVREATV